jgi:hypothetical protein
MLRSGSGIYRAAESLPECGRIPLPPSTFRPFTGAALLPIVLLAAGPAWGAAARKQDPTGPLVLLAWLPVILLVFVALEVVLWVLVPGPLVVTARFIDRGRGRCLLFGVLTAMITLALLALSSRYPAVGQTLVPIVLGLVALGSLTGITAVTALLGQGVLDLAERSGSRAVSVVVGSLLFGLVLLFPIVGLVLGLYFWLVGLGGALQALTRSPGRGK